VQQRLGRLGAESIDAFDLGSHEEVAERDLALELPRGGDRDFVALDRVGVGLADVVEQRAADGQVAVDAGKRGAIALTPWAIASECSSNPCLYAS